MPVDKKGSVVLFSVNSYWRVAWPVKKKIGKYSRRKASLYLPRPFFLTYERWYRLIYDTIPQDIMRPSTSTDNGSSCTKMQRLMKPIFIFLIV